MPYLSDWHRTGGFVATRLRPWTRPGRTVLIAVAGFGLATLGFGLPRSFVLSLACLFFTGVFDNGSVVIRPTNALLLSQRKNVILPVGNPIER